MKRIMIDIESLSLDPRALILSIGAVDFSAGELGAEFYVDVNAYTQPNRHISASTALWWIKQSVTNPAAATSVVAGVHKELPDALRLLAQYIEQIDCGEVWFNGPQFDAVVLSTAFADHGITIPWDYRNVRDLRTLKALAGARGWANVSTFPNGFIPHNALWDARVQAFDAISVMRYMGVE